jgi:periplasmic protein TonB
MSARLPAAALLALGVTFFLFWAMQALVSVEGKLDEGKPPLSIDFVRLRRDTTPQEKKREPPKREKPEQPPPPPDISMSKAGLDPSGDVAAIAPQIDASTAIQGGMGGGGGSDRDAVPLVRIEPDYPLQARQRGIEGWVVVEFTISKIGSIRDARVVAANPPRVFNQSAVQAVRKWKYNPKILNGAAVERKGIQVQLDFRMDQ